MIHVKLQGKRQIDQFRYKMEVIGYPEDFILSEEDIKGPALAIMWTGIGDYSILKPCRRRSYGAPANEHVMNLKLKELLRLDAGDIIKLSSVLISRANYRISEKEYNRIKKEIINKRPSL